MQLCLQPVPCLECGRLRSRSLPALDHAQGLLSIWIACGKPQRVGNICCWDSVRAPFVHAAKCGAVLEELKHTDSVEVRIDRTKHTRCTGRGMAASQAYAVPAELLRADDAFLRC